MAKGHVFVITVGGSVRLPQLVEALVQAGLDVVAEPPEFAKPAAFSDSQLLEKASALLLVLGAGADLEAHRTVLDRRLNLGSLIPLLLEPAASVDPSWHLRPVDLRSWSGGSDAELDRLIVMLQALVRGGRPHPGGGYEPSIDTSAAATDYAIGALRSLTDQVGTLGDVLIGDDRHRADLVDALDEVGATYRAVNDAIERYANAAGGSTGLVNRSDFHVLARTSLLERIHNGRGSCARIGTLYQRAGGLREALEQRALPHVLTSADQAFGELSGSDYTLFDQMERLGEALTAEARAIENLLIAGQDDAAVQRARAGWIRLAPLEDNLSLARRELQDLQATLGYVETPAGSEGVTVTISQVTINGSVHNSNIVAAQTIENSSFAVTAAAIPEDLKNALADLHRAVAELTAVLPDDEAALAARDLEDLAKEAMSPTPRPAFWRRAVEGLVGAAAKTAKVGGPVVDFATKVATMLATIGVVP